VTLFKPDPKLFVTRIRPTNDILAVEQLLSYVFGHRCLNR